MSTVYCPAHFIVYFIMYFFFLLHFFSIPIFMYILVCVCIPYNCTVHGVDLTYISLLVIFCIIVYVMNKKLES